MDRRCGAEVADVDRGRPMGSGKRPMEASWADVERRAADAGLASLLFFLSLFYFFFKLTQFYLNSKGI
jgi:hypothetical protein